jgi:hypothetical protein
MVDRTLLIGHRRTLIRGSCKRLGLLCYLDRNEDGSGHAQNGDADAAGPSSLLFEEN